LGPVASQAGEEASELLRRDPKFPCSVGTGRFTETPASFTVPSDLDIQRPFARPSEFDAFDWRVAFGRRIPDK
jgi:hypothetical protein